MASLFESLYGASSQFNEQQKLTAWQRAQIVPGRDARLIRKDSCGAWIKWLDYGNTNSEWGWEIDHIYPIARGGTDVPSNLQALHWRNNRAKGDSVGGFIPAVVAVQ